ncbi:hypothetical protein [Hymenobacter sp. BRD67]|uniref:hypothetical protein n=1 Tax=Hymenobacter sp. BRD67 TaxID=2675877 RepID=UPI001566F3CB|nr:hypothetical protein [Hymenobacter sp. BRD67]QKG54035.1 hypothetical protein GKZ67_17290 [Hymenobacter sp. BRD67]
MAPSAVPDAFGIAHRWRVPGLGLLVLPAAPEPAWLAAPALHSGVALRLHRPETPPLLLVATVEEIAFAGQPAAQALLLDADPGKLPAIGSWLELLTNMPEYLH